MDLSTLSLSHIANIVTIMAGVIAIFGAIITSVTWPRLARRRRERLLLRRLRRKLHEE